MAKFDQRGQNVNNQYNADEIHFHASSENQQQSEYNRLLDILRDENQDFLTHRKAIVKTGEIYVDTIQSVNDLLGVIKENEFLLFSNYQDIKDVIKSRGYRVGIPLTKILTDPNPVICKMAAEIISEINYKNAEPVLREILEKNDDMYEGHRKIAIQALNQLGGTHNINLLKNRLGKGSPEEDYEIIWALRGKGDSAVPALQEALRHKYDWIGEEAENALRIIATPMAMEALKQNVNRQRINCVECNAMPHAVQFPLGQKIADYGKVGLFKKWDKVLTCSFCGGKTGIKLEKK